MMDYIIDAVKFLSIRLGNIYGACGLAGNIMQESGMIANRMEIKWKKKTGWNDGWNNGVYQKELDTITAAINNGTYRQYTINESGIRNLALFKNSSCREAFANDNIGFGVCQWSSSGRKYSFFDFCDKWCKEKGISFDIGNLEMQLDFVIYELQTFKKVVYNVLSTCKDILTASNFVCVRYETPDGYNTEKVQNKRYRSSQEIFNVVFGNKNTLWFQHHNKWYYVEDGFIIKNKQVQYKNNWYYLSQDGSMAVNTFIEQDGIKYYINESGVVENNYE